MGNYLPRGQSTWGHRRWPSPSPGERPQRRPCQHLDLVSDRRASRTEKINLCQQSHPVCGTLLGSLSKLIWPLKWETLHFRYQVLNRIFTSIQEYPTYAPRAVLISGLSGRPRGHATRQLSRRWLPSGRESIRPQAWLLLTPCQGRQTPPSLGSLPGSPEDTQKMPAVWARLTWRARVSIWASAEPQRVQRHQAGKLGPGRQLRQALNGTQTVSSATYLLFFYVMFLTSVHAVAGAFTHFTAVFLPRYVYMPHSRYAPRSRIIRPRDTCAFFNLTRK